VSELRRVCFLGGWAAFFGEFDCSPGLGTGSMGGLDVWFWIELSMLLNTAFLCSYVHEWPSSVIHDSKSQSLQSACNLIKTPPM
jgi:hypothetical protein